MASADVKAYWSFVAELGCIVRGCYLVPQIAHVIGKPSITERVLEPKPKGKKLARHDWLVLPVCHKHHSVDANALDNNAAEFERRNGACADHVERIGRLYGIDPFGLSQIGRKI